MIQQRIKLREASLTKNCRVPRPVALWLKKQEIAHVQPTLDPTTYDLATGNFAGLVTYDGVLIEIEPKLSPERLLPLIAYGRTGIRVLPDLTNHGFDSFVDLLIFYFAVELQAVIRQGPLRGYSAVQETSRWFRGRLRIADQISRQQMSIQPLEVEFDDLTADIPENQILKTATLSCLSILQQRQYTSDSARLAREHLQFSLAQFTQVKEIPRYQPLPPWMRTQLNTRYWIALELADLILSNAGASARCGQISSPGILIEMWRVFESVVGRGIREALPELDVSTTYSRSLSSDISKKLLPDIVVVENERPIVVMDTKFKTGSPSSADLYQMITYATVFGLSSATLIYPFAGPDQNIRIDGTDIVISTRHLDFSRPLGEVRTQISAIARGSLST